ncbi:MAG: UDP-N-acetylmuramate--L-alanine ligase [bacterium]|nr:UDP-N-acetylmuramate--L-alanine ligase [bacterium]
MRYFFHQFEHLHFVGINGTGVSGIAELLMKHNFKVTGSDLVENDTTHHLRKLGAKIYIGHNPENVVGADLVIYSAACKMDNPELVEARLRRIPIVSRAEMLGEIMRLQLGVAVGGVHGKTTTTSMIGEAMRAAGLDTTVIVGGRLKNYGGNVATGTSEWMVAEADEFDRSFLKLRPVYVVLTNLEHEHIDTYPTYAEMEQAFIQFANSVPFYGLVIMCGDDQGLQGIRNLINRPVVTYGLSPQNQYCAKSIRHINFSTISEIYSMNEKLGELKLNVPGIHNVKNALAVIAFTQKINIPFDVVVHALGQFTGISRRFERIGMYNGAVIIDDYGHHPTEVAATLNSARNVHHGRLVVVFQPHLYSRTKAFAERFGLALMAADVVFVMDVYPAREEPIPNVTGKLITNVLRKSGHTNVYDLEKDNDPIGLLMKFIQPNDMVIFIGAGDINQISKKLVQQG